MPMNQSEFSNRSTLAKSLADRIGELLTSGIRKNGRASLAVSGGSTPVELFERLSELDIPWAKVVITLVDERWVEPEAEDSNEHLVRTHLLKNKATAATFIPMKNPAPTAGEARRHAQGNCRQSAAPLTRSSWAWGGTGIPPPCFPGRRNLLPPPT
ncbi:MAG: 6-phosphogluconolactonase [Desulfobulbaceae bacterium]|nr:6-phosphogluconolactonase [Desulfobulbaceae bacterium]